MNPNDAAIQLINLVLAITYVPIAAPLVTGLTAILKQFIPQTTLDAKYIAIALQAILWVIFVVAQHLGAKPEEISSAFSSFATIATALAGFIVSLHASQAIYVDAQKKGTPILGAQQPNPHD